MNTAELGARIDASYRQVDYWCREGVLAPIGAAMPGTGSPRRFSVREARVAAAVARLVELGVETPVLRRVAAQLREVHDWHGELLVSPLGQVTFLRYGQTASYGEACWVVNLDLCAARAA